MKEYTVTYSRDETGWWVAEAKGVAGVLTQGRSIAEARRRIREALALAIGDKAAERARLLDHVKLDPKGKRALERARLAQKRLEAAEKTKAKELSHAVKALTKDLGLSVRDAGELLGVSFQRIHQLAH